MTPSGVEWGTFGIIVLACAALVAWRAHRGWSLHAKFSRDWMRRYHEYHDSAARYRSIDRRRLTKENVELLESFQTNDIDLALICLKHAKAVQAEIPRCLHKWYLRDA